MTKVITSTGSAYWQPKISIEDPQWVQADLETIETTSTGAVIKVAFSVDNWAVGRADLIEWDNCCLPMLEVFFWIRTTDRTVSTLEVPTLHLLCGQDDPDLPPDACDLEAIGSPKGITICHPGFEYVIGNDVRPADQLEYSFSVFVTAKCDASEYEETSQRQVIVQRPGKRDRLLEIAFVAMPPDLAEEEEFWKIQFDDFGEEDVHITPVHSDDQGTRFSVMINNVPVTTDNVNWQMWRRCCIANAFFTIFLTGATGKIVIETSSVTLFCNGAGPTADWEEYDCSRADAAFLQPKEVTQCMPTQRYASLSKSAESRLPTAKPPASPSSAALLQTTTLPNGVRVATESTPGHFVSAGIYVDTGSRYENDRTRGCSHVLDRLAFKSTKSRSGEQMSQELEFLGGQFLSSSSRETIMYQASSYTHSLPKVIALLADTVLNPLITQQELDEQRQAIFWEIKEIKAKPEMILPEILHETAFSGNTLGNPLLCPDEHLESMTPETLRAFVKMWYRPERIVLAGAGIDHQALLDIGREHFGHLPSSITPAQSTSQILHPSPVSSSKASAPRPYKNLSTSAATRAREAAGELADLVASEESEYRKLAIAKARYTGGTCIMENDELEFSHIYIGYEGLSIHDPDIYALATLQVLLGGGSSFSAGGPGKGMYSRLYTSVLNQYHTVDFAAAFHHCYLDSGLFGLALAVAPSFVRQAPQLIAQQLDVITRPAYNGISLAELSRARNQLKSSLMMALESRMVQVEDLGRQVQVHGHKIPVEVMCERIDAVTLDDLHRVATRVLRPDASAGRSGQPTIVFQGNTRGLPDVKSVLRKYGLAGR
ncbi:uncharacterized protein L969DRAFT_94973 [Mixia osmundae IAM 14324]|uniref:Alpha-MPP n=1 Tax=Mixia osmundae (strain CBS 9802 / IAM 14324 / JCM 22182 / KY 12970) TaxID=764103 RepID=G7E156_MIXOS|nr:uncharacterized protein L969DRAFT_94973 [Mixia osmundae IAM 14324]KEI38795.1 hypothetical protein L969DRAFT_94973 [Mixia osmundae IAM 14324]GAA96566.1 hypothetical protein E5Q_03235 [Mixia osmundae IAM 14324]